MIRQYVEASNRGDARALAALYADDALLLPPNQALVQGRPAIEAFWRDELEAGFAFETLRVDVDGATGYVVARYLVTATDAEPADSGKAVLCLKRQPDGTWKVAADIWNTMGEEDGDTTREEPVLPMS